MMNRKQWSILTAAALVFSMTAGTAAFAADGAFSIELSGDNEAWKTVAMVNDDAVETGVVIRSESSADSPAEGYLYRGGAVTVLGEENGWTKIRSGNVTGYVRSEYLTFGTEAKGLAEYYGEYGVKASWDDVKVFAADDKDAKIIGTANDGDTYPIVNNNGHWLEIRTGEDETAYVSEEDTDLVILVDSAYGVNDEEGPSGASSPAAAAPAEASGEESYEESAAQADYNYAEDTSYTEQADYSYAADSSYTEQADNSYVADSSYTEQTDNSYAADNSYTEQTDYSYVADASYEEQADYSASEETGYEEQIDYSAAENTGYEEQADYSASEESGYEQDGYTEDTSSYEEVYAPDDVSEEPTYEDYSEDTDIYDDDGYEDYSTQDQGSEDYAYEDTSSSDSSASSSSSDVDLLAAIIYHEAGNQPEEGKIAVGAVVLNRVYSSSFPNTISEVLYQPGQFTPASELASTIASGVPSSCYDAAYAALGGQDPTGGCLYFNTSHGSGVHIGAHWFY